jgi:hypothetical protein
MVNKFVAGGIYRYTGRGSERYTDWHVWLFIKDLGHGYWLIKRAQYDYGTVKYRVVDDKVWELEEDPFVNWIREVRSDEDTK